MNLPDPEIEKRDLAREYRRLLRGAEHSKSPEDRKRIRKAWELAVEAHKDMRRRSGEAYIFTPSPARICSEEMGLDTTSIVCAPARHGRGHVGDAGRHRADVRQAGAHYHRWADQNLRHFRRGAECASGELPEDAALPATTSGSSRSRTGSTTCGRWIDEAREAAQDCRRDRLHVRAPGPPPGPVRHQE